MAIRDRLRRALHRSDASDTFSRTDSNIISSDTASHSFDLVPLEKTASRLARAILFGSLAREKDKEQQRATDKRERRTKNNSNNNNNTTTSTSSNSNSTSTSSNIKTTTTKHGRRRHHRTHPRDKPLTAQNIRHQEMLSHFSMTFGASDPSQIETRSFIGVSPCCTRPASPRASFAHLDTLSRGPSFATSFSNSSSSATDSSS